MTEQKVVVMTGGRSVEPLIAPLSNAFTLAFLDSRVADNKAKEGLSVLDLKQLQNPAHQAKAMAQALRLYQSVQPSIDNGTLAELMSVISKNESLGRSFGEQLSDWFPGSVFTSLLQNITQIEIWKEVMAHFKVAACITHEDVSEQTKCMASFFREKKVPTLHVPHAVYMDQWRGAVGQDVHDDITAEWIAAAGPYQRDWYIARGAKPRKVVITGLPHWDKWAKDLDGAWARRSLRLDQDRPIVMYASSWAQQTSAFGMHGAVEETYAGFLKVAALGDFQTIVKLHPSAGKASNDWHLKQAQDAGVKGMITAQYLDLCMASADLIVSVGPSNLLIEASMLGKPSVCVHGFDMEQEIISTEIADMADAIEVGLSDHWQKNFHPEGIIARYAHKNDGQATQRVLDLIKRIV